MELEELGIREECGVFGCIASGEWPTQLDVPHVITLGLEGLQHRGQESAGIVNSDGNSIPTFKTHKGMGLLNHVFTEDNLKKLYTSNLGIGPTRKKLLRHGIGLSTSSDSEMITHLLAYTPPQEQDDTPDWVARIKNLMKEAPTAYSLLIMHKDVIYAVRDPYGNRPLCIGQTEGWVVSSESCSFLSIGARYYREVLPGEIVEIARHIVQTLDIIPRSEGKAMAFCIFEYVYFARPDSIFEDQMVYTVKYCCGQQLAIEAPVDADLVSTVPESATPAALGYATKCGLPYVEVLCKNRYVGRTFIQPNMRLRQLGVAKKFGVLSDNFKGKRIVLVDDSIVRDNTISPIIKLLKESGAKEVHIHLIANKPEFEHISDYLGANSVVYLSVEGLVSSVQEGITLKKQRVKKQDIMVQENGNGLECFENNGHSCLTRKYPVELEW
uniref:Amidophosphoribosyltransferase n=1 Tax=Capra hircus TaxID=9925 RepID=A0A452G2L9_CAPHI